ncbi:YkgJ family cysteine cluster protein [Flavobacterium sp. WG21]|uniref:YkgJ family cysteine cluster protein n=1 Tax=Flavobacterium sp. WG21 TaxID=1229487 RepID=UPI00034DAEB1|nr:YkgJ family cysteine cluster protein [Flavobacterium sp. WG21]
MDITQIKNKTLEIYKETDDFVNRFPNCCKKGCSFCCHQNIQIIHSEELVITEYLEYKVSNEIKAKIKVQLTKWLEYFNLNTPDRILEQSDIVRFEKQISADRIPCPFLIEGNCSIYPVRPLTCRTHIVDSHPEACDKNIMRDGNPYTKHFRDFKAIELLKSAPNNTIRLLPYVFRDYFGVVIKIKGVEVFASR